MREFEQMRRAYERQASRAAQPATSAQGTLSLVRAPAPKTLEGLLIEIKGRHGTVIVETTRPIGEVVAWLAG